MKPDWKKAPKWANWMAKDEDGSWYFYSEKPERKLCMWRTYGGKTKSAGKRDTSWKKSLEERPKEDEREPNRV